MGQEKRIHSQRLTCLASWIPENECISIFDIEIVLWIGDTETEWEGEETLEEEELECRLFLVGVVNCIIIIIIIIKVTLKYNTHPFNQN